MIKDALAEENPFEDPIVSREWINSVENEKDGSRDKEIYPRLQKWIENIKPGIVVEIGSGQGICSDKMGNFLGKYIGIEPSNHLFVRACELYERNGREFIVGSAYEIPISDELAGAVFSVNVWFHLENIDKASAELERILKRGGKFMIITPNPDSFDLWESWFIDYKKEGKKIVGKVKIPVNPLSKNIIYKHSLKEMEGALKRNGLVVDSVESFSEVDGYNIFISISGRKP